MHMKFHYNKTTIQQFRKELLIRERALPILKNKETALRREEKIMVKSLNELQMEYAEVEGRLALFHPYWIEFPHMVTLSDPVLYFKKIVGVKVPEIDEVSFDLVDLSWWNYPAWVSAGIEILQQSLTLSIQINIKRKQIELVNAARKKTTQKVNLYEKVQIPAYEEAILKIKRFIEDQENVSKAAQKIVKKRKERKVPV